MNEWIYLISFIVVFEVNNYKRLYVEKHSLGSGGFGEVFVAKKKGPYGTFKNI